MSNASDHTYIPTSDSSKRYRLLEKLGDGASAEVYRAQDRHLDRVVALKLLRAQFLSDGTARQRFVLEARTLAGLSHPNIVEVYDVGEEPDGSMFIAMKYIEGINLRQFLSRRGTLSPTETMSIARDVCKALLAAHKAGIVHRDVKPQNIIIGKDGTACLTDFGIVKTLSGPALTQAGVTYGTAAYMSPEQATGDPVGPGSDIYSLGCVMYEMLSGQAPFGGDTPAAVTYKQVWERPSPLRKVASEVPPALETVVMRCLQKDPTKRYPTASLLAKELQAIADAFNQPTQAVQVSAVMPRSSAQQAPSSQPTASAQTAASISSLLRAPITAGNMSSMMRQQTRPTPSRPAFQRAPRLYPDLPEGEVEIPQPPPAPTAPNMSILPVLLPALFAVGAAVATITFLNTNVMFALLSFGFMAISSLTSLLSYSSQRRSYRREARQRQERYRALLDTTREELRKLRDQQQAASTGTDPEPRECLARMERSDRRLWERSPKDSDFLWLRLGCGDQPFAGQLKLPRQDRTLAPDPLIQEAQEVGKTYSNVQDMPIRLPLPEAGVAGIVGPRGSVVNSARALALQIATHHSPDEVKIAAFFPTDEGKDWDWLRWLPHVWTDDRGSRFLASDKNAAHRLLINLYDLLNKRLLQRSAARDPSSPPPLPYIVFFLADPSLLENEPILHLLLTEAPSVGAFPIFLADRIESLPKGCQDIVELSSGGQSQLIQTSTARARTPFTPDSVSRDLAERLSRATAPIRLRRVAMSSEVPTTVTLLDVLGAASVEALDVPTRWQSSESYKSLAVPIGRRAGGELLHLDMHEHGHGPHGLAAGATGSGKSELLQSLVASLATNFHPHQVAFVLIDYKGGGMANAFLELPHLVGTITNLQGSLASRALAATKSELQRRQSVLAKAGVNQIDEYQKLYRQGAVPDPLPHLIIIADEFAELTVDQPDFMKELVSAVRVGRSLGVHLLLATQKPAGVVNEQIWSNTRFRISLRVERPEDSQEVLKRPDAAYLAQAGRAYFQVGNNEVFEMFQAAWGGAPYVPDKGAAVLDGKNEVIEVDLDGSRHHLRGASQSLPDQQTLTQLHALVSHLQEVAENEGIKRLAGPWLPPLSEQVALDGLRGAQADGGWDGQMWRPSNKWLEPIIGLVDDPARQFQGPIRLNLGKEGHLAVYGAPGSGKTTFVQTLVTSLALEHSPQDLNIYLLDFGGRLLGSFEPLPHVGGVMFADEAEKLSRLLRSLLREIEVRKTKFAKAGVNTLTGYRKATGEGLPAMLLVLDNYSGFASAFPDADEQLEQLAREGGNLGVHIVLTANSPNLIRTKISGNISLGVALQLKDRSDYSMVVGRTNGLEPAPVAGRGLIKDQSPLEFQTAFPVKGDTDAERTTSLKSLVAHMAQEWTGPRAKSVPVLPTVIALSDLVDLSGTWPTGRQDPSLDVPLGLDVENLEPMRVDLNDGPHFLITGPVQSGKTTLLRSWLLALAARFSPEQLDMYLIDFSRSGLLPLKRLPHVRSYIEDDDKLREVLADISNKLRERRQALDEARHTDGALDEQQFILGYPAIVIAVEDFEGMHNQIQMESQDRLEQLLRRERGLGMYTIVAGSASDIASSYEGWVRAIKELQTGFLLGSNDSNDLQVLNLKLPYAETGLALAAGEGYYSRRGKFRKVKVATPQSGNSNFNSWVTQLVQRGEKQNDT
jgi:S-DNA-T family DNA segregation ATPase FtsK/SpoIIIE